MTYYANKLKNTINSKQEADLKRKDITSVTEFKKGLDKGKLEIGSLSFTGQAREVKLIKKICDYLGLQYKGKENIACGWMDCDTRFNVVHYTVSVKS